MLQSVWYARGGECVVAVRASHHQLVHSEPRVVAGAKDAGIHYLQRL